MKIPGRQDLGAIGCHFWFDDAGILMSGTFVFAVGHKIVLALHLTS